MAPGPDQKGRALCFEHAGQTFGSLTEAPGQPSTNPLVIEETVVMMGMGQPQEVPDEEHEQIVQRVASVDVAKAFGKVCTRVPHESRAGRRVTTVWDVPATTNAILELASHLQAQGVERVVVESTSDYWRPFYYLLESRGLCVWLVNAADVKNVPGRPKTDKLDAVWLAKLAERGMLRPSFVPPAQIRQLRDYTRLRVDLTHDRSRHKQRLEKLLEDALIKLSSVATDMLGMSGREMIDALISGQRDPRVLADMARGKLQVKRPQLVEALNGRFDDHHAYLAKMLLDQIDGLTAQIDRLTTTIEQAIAAIPAAQAPTAAQPEDGRLSDPPGVPRSAIDRLDEVAGIGHNTAQTIIAEVGLNMNQFATAGHLVSWAKLSPRTIQSGAKQRGGKIGKGNPYLKGALGEAAVAAAKTNTFLGERYRRLVKRCGKLKALVGVARSILVIVWHLLADPFARYRDLGADYHTTRIDKDRKTRQLVHQLQVLGHTVTLQPAA